MPTRDDFLQVLDFLGHNVQLTNRRARSVAVCSCGLESGERRSTTDAEAWAEHHRREEWRHARTADISDPVLDFLGITRADLDTMAESDLPTWSKGAGYYRQDRQVFKRRR